MKTFVLFILFIVNSSWVWAQITHENTYTYSATMTEISDNEFRYYLMDVTQKQCRIYTTEHILDKTINLPIPDGYYVSDIKFVSRNLFNNDDLIELLCIYEKYVSIGTGYFTQYGMTVINENGSKLLELPNGGWAEIVKVEERTKLIAYAYVYNSLGYYDVATSVYNLGGATSIIGKSNDIGELVSPNPANDYLNVDVSLIPKAFGGVFTIYSVNGQKVLTSSILSSQKMRLSIQDLPKGSYIYTIQNKSKVLHSNTFIIK